MLDIHGRQSLKQLLDTVSETEMIIDDQRYELNRNPHFAPLTAFHRIDRMNRNGISSSDLQAFFQQNGHHGISIGECGKVIQTFDRNQDGLLTVEDFSNMVLNCKDKHLRLEAQHRQPNRCGSFAPLHESVERQLVQIFLNEVDLQKRVLLLMKDLKRQPGYSIQSVFNTVDSMNEKFWNPANIGDFFLHCCGVSLIMPEIYAMIRRMSTHMDARVSLEEFAAFVGEPLYHDSRPNDRYIEHRATEFQTPSHLSANIERTIADHR